MPCAFFWRFSSIAAPMVDRRFSCIKLYFSTHDLRPNKKSENEKMLGKKKKK
jgi:hypothetical protein